MSKAVVILAMLLVGVSSASVAFAESATTSPSVLYVPLIGITSVPDPLALPDGAGPVTYNYAVKNFLTEVDLTNVQVTDDKCAPVRFAEGDDNNDGRLNYNETWRYKCTTTVSTTTQNVATATGIANGVTATHAAYSTVVVGSKDPAPLVSIVNITKIASPLSLPKGGGDITFTYRVNNPGSVPLSSVTVSDNKCDNISNHLGDTNGNNLLDPNEVWVYYCTARLAQTTTNTATVTATANGFTATDNYTLTVTVAGTTGANPGLPNTGTVNILGKNLQSNLVIWAILIGILAILTIIFFLIKLIRRKSGNN